MRAQRKSRWLIAVSTIWGCRATNPGAIGMTLLVEAAVHYSRIVTQNRTAGLSCTGGRCPDPDGARAGFWAKRHCWLYIG
jgi:hypothetical protein